MSKSIQDSNDQQSTSVIKKATSAWLTWNAIEIEQRITLISQWSELLKLQHSLGLLPGQMVDFHSLHAVPLISSGEEMPGPTGESNVLSTSGRGPFVIMAEQDAPIEAFIALVSCALVAGNSVVMAALPEHEDIISTLEQVCTFSDIEMPIIVVENLASLEKVIVDPAIAGVGFVGSEVEAIRLNRVLAERDGQIALLIVETDLEGLEMVRDQSLVLRFITEKTLTTNVTAVGGNATLLALGCGE
jgi:delta 1-pyrroline-5-carboxylate dehydrogenase